MDVGEEMRLGGLTGLRGVDHVACPLCTALVAITRLDIVGRFESLSRLGQLTVGLESNQALARHLWVATFIVALPSAPQGVDQGQMPQAGRGLIIIQGIEQGKAISADALGVGVALGRLARGKRLSSMRLP